MLDLLEYLFAQAPGLYTIISTRSFLNWLEIEAIIGKIG